MITCGPFSGVLALLAGNVVYIDAETPYDEYCANLEQHGLAGEAGHRFFGISKFAPRLPEFCETFSLTDAKLREGLLHYLLTHQCRYVFLDNLTALMGDAVHQGKAAQEVLDWVENLQKHGLCVVLVHHKSEYETIAPQKDKARGSQLFIIRARTVIGLVNKKEILDESLGAAAVQKSALQDGLTIGIRYQVSKPAPILEGKTFWLYLPLGASEWTFLAATGHGSKEIDFFPSEAPTLTQSDGSQASSTDSAREAGGMSETEEASMADGLTEDQHKLYEYANRYSEISTGNAAKRLNCGETKAREVLKSLVEQGLLEDNGKKGPALAYHLKK